MAPQVAELVQGRARGSYLPRDGWWAQRILDEFEFLPGWGYRLKGVFMSHDHHEVVFEGTDMSVVFGYQPDYDNGVVAYSIFSTGPKQKPHVKDFDEAMGLAPLRSRPPTRWQFVRYVFDVWSPRRVADRMAIERRIAEWAEGLRALALAGIKPERSSS